MNSDEKDIIIFSMNNTEIHPKMISELLEENHFYFDFSLPCSLEWLTSYIQYDVIFPPKQK